MLWIVLVAVVLVVTAVAPTMQDWYYSVAYTPTGKTVSVRHTGDRFAVTMEAGTARVGSVEARGFALNGVNLDPADFDGEKKFDVLAKRWEWLPGLPERTVEVD